MRILLAAVRCPKGDLEANAAQHRHVVDRAADLGCDVAVLPEMSLTGSVDPTTHPDRLIDVDHPTVLEVVAMTANTGVAAVFGVAERAGPVAYITQCVAAGGRLLGVQRKRHLGEGEEAFTPANEDEAFEIGGRRVAVAICAESGYERPFSAAASREAGLVLFCAAPGLYGRRRCAEDWRRGWEWWTGRSLGESRAHARRHGLWIGIATQAGSTDDEDFPGLAALVSPAGQVVAQLADWRPGLLAVEVPE